MRIEKKREWENGGYSYYFKVVLRPSFFISFSVLLKRDKKKIGKGFLSLLENGNHFTKNYLYKSFGFHLNSMTEKMGLGNFCGGNNNNNNSFRGQGGA